ncbi:MAG: bifunctional hydroxymethylpyrimidine kinase/phosphomethylpyrimidine kinase [Thermodesulfobacteriota bacterium]
MKARILTIAGSDSGGGAGIQADLKAIAFLGAYGTSVITALTAQNTLGVQGIFPIPPIFVKKQLTSVLSDIGADAAKTGMLFTSEVIATVAGMIKKYKILKLVVDPLMISESGQRLSNRKAVTALREKLFPLAGLITPNLSEASVLTGFPVRTLRDMKKAARLLKAETNGGVLIKGGHLDGAAVDLFYDGLVFHKLTAPRLRTPHTHGTGCTLSAAITTFWGQDFSLTEALKKAKLFVTRAIAGAEPIGHGRGPTNPYARIDGIPRSAEAARGNVQIQIRKV